MSQENLDLVRLDLRGLERGGLQPTLEWAAPATWSTPPSMGPAPDGVVGLQAMAAGLARMAGRLARLPCQG